MRMMILLVIFLAVCNAGQYPYERVVHNGTNGYWSTPKNKFTEAKHLKERIILSNLNVTMTETIKRADHIIVLHKQNIKKEKKLSIQSKVLIAIISVIGGYILGRTI